MRSNINVYILLLIILALVFSFLTIYSFGYETATDISVSAYSAVLYQPETDTFLYSKSADIKMPMASTTKIMTALIALENADLTDTVVIDERAVGVEGSSAYLRIDDILTMEELLYALLLQSANDAAVAIACHISGDVEGFADLMNSKATDLGLTDTNFTNPHGLDDKNHYTTARELAIITAEAMKNEGFRKISSTYKKTFSTEDRTRTYVNHNKMLLNYEGCIGVKTGYTQRSGRCLVVAAERNGREFISVTLDAPNDWSDHTKLLDYGYDTLERIDLAKVDEYCYNVPIINGDKESILVTNDKDISIIVEKGDHSLNKHIKLIRYAVAPVSEGDVLGEIIFTVDGKEVDRCNLVARENAGSNEKKSLLDRLTSLFN